MSKTTVAGGCLLMLAFAYSYAGGQSPASDRLQRSAAAFSLDDAASKPWYLKASFQLFDAKGAASEKGTFEEWWAGPHTYRRVFTSPSFTSTDGETADGAFRTTNTAYPSYSLETVAEQFIHPMPSAKEVEQATLDTQQHSFGKVSLECIMLSRPIKGRRTIPLGLFPTYCFDRGRDEPRMSMKYVNESIVRNGLGRFSGHIMPIDIQLNMNDMPVVKAHLEELRAIDVDQVDFTMPASASKVEKKAAELSGKVVSGSKIGGDDPSYPPTARINHVTGTVILRAIIGRDGHIRSLSVNSAPDIDLAISALAAARTWVYKPYLLNGEPTEVDTNITVNYLMSP